MTFPGTRALSLAALLALTGSAFAEERASAADEFEIPDSKVTGEVKVVPWEPAILEMFVASGGASAQEAYKAGKAPPGLREAWALIRQEARPRATSEAGSGADVFGAQDPVYAGWRVDDQGQDAGTSMLVALAGSPAGGAPGEGPAPTPGPARLPTFLAAEEVRLFCNLDVFMPLNEDDRISKIKLYFRILEWRVTIHEVSGDPASFRGPARAAPVERLPVVRVGSETEAIGSDFPQTQGTLFPKAQFSFRTRGVYEVRAFVRVKGQLNGIEEPQVKTAEAAIRVAVTDQAVDVGVLNFDRLNLPSRPRGKQPPTK